MQTKHSEKKLRSQNKASSFSKHSLISSTEWRLLSGSAFRRKQLVESGGNQLAESKAPVEVLRIAREKERHVMDRVNFRRGRKIRDVN